MDAYWVTAYLILAGLVIVESLLLALQTWEHRRYVRSCMRGLARHQPTGRVALFAPCKGLDLDLEANLRAMLRQDYDDYEVTFIVENTDDPAYPAIRRAMAEHPWVPARVVVAGRATDSGQKVHNLRVATQHLSRRVQVPGVCRFRRPAPARVAADARVAPGAAGAGGGHRLSLVHARAAHRGQRLGLQHELRRDVAADAQQPLPDLGRLVGDPPRRVRRHRPARRLEGNAQRRPGGQPADAAVAAGGPLRAGLRGGLAAWTCRLARRMSFIRRQYLVARLYTFDWWLFSLLAATFSNAIWLGNLGVLVWGLLTGSPSPWIPIAVSAVLYLVTVYRGSLRQDLVKTYFPHWEKASRRIRGFDIWANPLVEFAHWIGVASAAVGRYVNWRGIRYHVLPGGQVQKIIRDDAPTVPKWQRQESLLRRKAG